MKAYAPLFAKVSSSARKVNFGIEGLRTGEHNATITTLHQDKPEDENTIDNPGRVVPEQIPLKVSGPDDLLFNVIKDTRESVNLTSACKRKKNHLERRLKKIIGKN